MPRISRSVVVGQAGSREDVWNKDLDLCAYCAERVEYQDDRCPSCGRDLWYSFFRYAKPSTNLHVLWVLLASLGQLYVISAGLIYMGSGTADLALSHLFLAAMCLVLAIGVYFRKWLSYIAAVPMLLFMAVFPALALAPPSLAVSEEAGVLINWFVSPLLTVSGKAVSILQLIVTMLGAIWAITLVGPDFTRDRGRLIAQVAKGLTEPSSLFAEGKRYAARGMWATAAMHWQRAAALNPTNGYYLQALGDAYMRLGFTHRALGVLRMSLPYIHAATDRAKVTQKIAELSSSAS